MGPENAPNDMPRLTSCRRDRRALSLGAKMMRHDVKGKQDRQTYVAMHAFAYTSKKPVSQSTEPRRMRYECSSRLQIVRWMPRNIRLCGMVTH